MKSDKVQAPKLKKIVRAILPSSVFKVRVPKEMPGAIFVGGMGSGKSVAYRYLIEQERLLKLEEAKDEE